MDVNTVIKELINSNKELENTLLNGFINENTIKYLPFYVLETFAINKEAQEAIIKLPEIHLKHISKIIKYAESVNQDWMPLCVNYYHFLNNKYFSNLVADVSRRELDESQIENFLFIINNGRNYYNINSIDEINKLGEIRDDFNIKNKADIDPNLLLLNKYGISYVKAFNIYKRYGKDIDNLPESLEKDFLVDIKNIIEGKGTDKKIFDYPVFIVNIDSFLRNYFSKIYDDKFYTPTTEKQIGEINNIKIYDAGLDFNMCVYSYGLASDYNRPENFKDAWNRPNISTDYMCNSIINSSSLKTKVKHCLFGFKEFGKNNLALLGSNDLGTGGIYKNINVTNPFYQEKLIADVEFRTPDSLINNTRFTNNEVYRSRRKVVNGKLERINPDYIVYLKTDDDFNNQIWDESLQAANDFNIPIVIVDCKRCLETNKNIIEKKLGLFEKRLDASKVLKSIVELIHTLSYGYNFEPANKILGENFNREIIYSYFNRIINHIDKISDLAPNNALECIDIILNTLDSEYEKILKSPHWVEQYKKTGGNVEKPYDIINILEEKRRNLQIIIKELENEENKIDKQSLQ